MGSASSPSRPVQLFARLSTSMKMLVLMSLALAPLGLIASLASIETAASNRASRMVAARLLAGDSADQLNLYFDRVGATLRAARRLGSQACRRADEALSSRPPLPASSTIHVAVFNGAGRLVCADRGLDVGLPLRPSASGPTLSLDPHEGAARMIVGGQDGAGWALATIPARAMARVSHPDTAPGSYSLALFDATGATLTLETMESLPIGRVIQTVLPVVGGKLHLRMSVVSAPLSANELLLMLLPILMWLAGAAIGWLVVDRLLVRPLAQVQAAVDRYRVGGGRLVLPVLTTPALEIRQLGNAFSGASETIALHEAELEEGLTRQTKLTREVHHRVKNNLQVVASLLNIHARGADTVSAANAYATIQRRVDALALVHRSHFAELEVNRGVALRPLIGELASTLRGSIPAGVAPPQITLDLAQRYANQDTAVSVAFFVTEAVEAAMLRAPGTSIAIRLAPSAEDGTKARLSVLSPALTGDNARPGEGTERFERVIGGLARQMRATLERDLETGLIAVAIAVMPEGENGPL